MPSLKNILHKRDSISKNKSPIPTTSPEAIPTSPPPPEITFLRSDTFGHEVITPPVYPDHHDHHQNQNQNQTTLKSDDPPSTPTTSSPRRSFQLFRRSSSARSLSNNNNPSPSSPSQPPRRERGLSNLLHLDHRSRSNSRDSSSANIPQDLPQIEDEQGDEREQEAQWEKRATVLVQKNPHFGPTSPIHSPTQLRPDLERSTKMFGQLADPNGTNNPLSQVLYGLALRHGWGCIKDETRAVTYLSAAASNSADIESEALRAGIKKGGAAKGELVLAIFELANCFRNGWGVEKDPAAARQYYETAANLGDLDAMDQVAWCYIEGFGGKKDKVSLVQ
ncbi:hypothetical protein N7481_000384 [Penicillium waksmanii]|uniref:uncharacterized protein n=1 Tax=Penicillium waksmanii TaxID=69791 RepID=UPI002547CA42|nr:uncharacterized protein N7481_000384 [Penicillium waksmanii]KAJ5999975.1 hypothetical protein N7481_000384 [Penicillium waksmanii]